MGFDFHGKKILVTGAGRGIGRTLSVALNDAGCTVYALSRTQATLDSLVAERPGIVPLCVDLADWDNSRARLEDLPVLDGLVNNAVISGSVHAALDVSKQYLDTLMEVNLKAAINCIQVIAKKMVENKKSGSIVNLSSNCSMLAFPGLLATSVCKAGLDMVTKQFALELGPHNIRVNSVNPTMVRTESEQKIGSVEKLLVERTPLGRMATVAEVVAPVMYLLDDRAAAMVTGTCQLVDGGLACNITTKTLLSSR